MHIKFAAFLLGLAGLEAAETAVVGDGDASAAAATVANTDATIPETSRPDEESPSPYDRRALAERAARNRDDLKREYVELRAAEEEDDDDDDGGGGNTEERRRRRLADYDAEADRLLDAAIAEARAASPKFGEAGAEWTLMRPVPGLEKHYDPEKQKRALNHVLGAEKSVHLVSAMSPGWDINYGRNEFYCASVDIKGSDYLPTEGSDLLLLDCTNVYWFQYAFDYEVDHRMTFYGFDGVFFNYCAETSATGLVNGTDFGNGTELQTVQIQKCDNEEPLQEFTIFGDTGDNSWRPTLTESVEECITADPYAAAAKGHRGKISGIAPQPPGGVQPGNRELRGRKKNKKKKKKNGGGKKKKKKNGGGTKNKNRGGKKNKKSGGGGGGGGNGASRGALRVEPCATPEETERRGAQTFLLCAETTQCSWEGRQPTCFPSNAVCL